MKPIYYKSSEGVIVNLIQAPYRMLTETELLNSEWKWETVGTNYPKITALKKELVSPPFKVRVTGATKEAMLTNLEHIESVFDRDCFLGQMGRLYIGDFYRECFITSSTKGKVFEKNHTVVEYVATSNDGYWKKNKEITLYGSGMIIGEMANTVTPSAKVNGQDIVWAPNADNTCAISWSGSYDSQWLKFDMGTTMDIDSFSGLHLRGSSTPISCSLQIGDGEVATDDRSISAPANDETNRINVDGFKELKVTSFGYGWNDATLLIYGYVNGEHISSILVKTEHVDKLGQDIDVSMFEQISFWVGYTSSGTTTVNYTVYEEQWETIDTYSVAEGQTEEVTLSNQTCRYIRLYGNYLGSIEDDEVSIISGEEAPQRNLFDLGYETENILSIDHREEQGDLTIITVEKPTQPAYITFDDYTLLLKNIYFYEFRQGKVIIQGLNNDTWTDIATIDDSFNTNYNTDYDKIRVKIPVSSSPITQPNNPAFNNGSIGVLTECRIVNDAYAPSDAIIRLYGAWNNPTVNIGGVDYGSTIELEEDHYLEINTKEHTVYDIADDSNENVYSSKLDDSFEKIATGEQLVDWVGNAEKIEIILEQARSTPKWN